METTVIKLSGGMKEIDTKSKTALEPETENNNITVWENEDFKITKNNEGYFVCDNGYGYELIVSIDDYEHCIGNDCNDFVYKISPWHDEKMSGDIEYQLKQLNKSNFTTYGVE